MFIIQNGKLMIQKPQVIMASEKAKSHNLSIANEESAEESLRVCRRKTEHVPKKKYLDPFSFVLF